MPEVAARADQAPAKVVLPNPVHHHASGQRMIRLGEPIGEGRPASGRLRSLGSGRNDGWRVLQNGGESRLNGFASALRNLRRWSDWTDIPDGERHGERRRTFSVKGSEFLAQLGQGFLVLGLQSRGQAVVFVGDLPIGQGSHLTFPGRPIRFGLAQNRLNLRRKLADRTLRQLGSVRRFEGVNLGAQAGGLFFPGGLLAGVFRTLGRGGGGQLIVPLDAGEEGLQAEVIFLQQGIELVVVTPRALESQAQEDIAGGVGDVGQHGVPLAGGVPVVVLVNAQAQVTGRDLGVGFVGVQFVAGQLFLHEAVVGLIGVERADHVVPVAPRGGAQVVGLVAIGIGVADQIQPMAGPAFAVAGTGEQAIHEPFVGIGTTVRDKLVNLRG